MLDDPILAAIDERLAELKAAVPRDLTRITAGDPPLGLEHLVTQALGGDVRHVEGAGEPSTGSVRRVRLSALVRKSAA
jgi:hypothetical protein